MKKLALISGIASANLMMFGSMFKVFRWPFADVMLITATVIFSLIFLPTALISWQRTTERKSVHLPVAIFISFFVGVIAILFKVEHWQYGPTLLMLAIPLPFIVFLPSYLIHTRKDKLDKSFIPIMMGLVFIAVLGVLLAAK